MKLIEFSQVLAKTRKFLVLLRRFFKRFFKPVFKFIEINHKKIFRYSQRERRLRNYFDRPFLKVIQLVALSLALFILGLIYRFVLFLVLGLVLGTICGLWIYRILQLKISDTEVDELLEEGIERLVTKSLDKLDFDESEIVAKKPEVIMGPITEDSPGISSRDRVSRRERAIFSDFLIWLVKSMTRIQEDRSEHDLRYILASWVSFAAVQFWKIKNKVSKKLPETRYGAWEILVLQFTEHNLGIYVCDYNLIKNVTVNETTYQCHYQDIVSISTIDESTSDKFPEGVKFVKTRKFSILLANGDPITVPLKYNQLELEEEEDRENKTHTEKNYSSN